MEKPNLQLKEVKDKISDIFNKLVKLGELLSSQDKRTREFSSLKKYFDSKKHLLNQLEDKKYYIAFLGPYSTGKSTLINAILEKDLLPENLEKATTAFPTYIYSIPNISKEKADIIYSNRNERDQLKEFYLKILKVEFELEDLHEYLKMENAELISILEEKSSNLDVYDKNSFTILLTLLNKWDYKLGESEEKTIDDIKKYVEEEENSVIISRADIYIQNSSLFGGRNDVVLVDLPGVDAFNPRHFETTKHFTITDAKSHAYIFVSAPEKIESGKANEFLLELAKHTKQITKAFWVLNRCDQLKNLEEVESSKQLFILNNKKKINNLDVNRVYAVSAKKYKDRTANDDNDPLVRNINILRERFISYLKEDFEQELAETNIKEYEILKNKLLLYLEPKVGRIKFVDKEDQNLAIQLEIIESKLIEWEFEAKEKLELIFEDIDNKIHEFDFINEDVVNGIMKKVENIISKSDLKITNRLKLPKDIDSKGSDSIINDLQESISLNEFIREAFTEALDSEGELSDILNIYNNYCTGYPEIKDQIIKKSSIIQRFEGICDIALKDYSTIFTDATLFIIKNDINNIRAYLALFAKDRFNEEISFNKDRIQVENNLIGFILDPDLEKYDYEKIQQELGLQSDIDFSKLDFHEYAREIIYQKMSLYMIKIKTILNEYIKICLANFFKDLYVTTNRFLNSKDLHLKLRLIYTKEIQENKDTVATETDRKNQVYQIYTNLRNTDE